MRSGASLAAIVDAAPIAVAILVEDAIAAAPPLARHASRTLGSGGTRQTHAVRAHAARAPIEQQAMLVPRAARAEAEVRVAERSLGRAALVGGAAQGAGGLLLAAILAARRVCFALQGFAVGAHAVRWRELGKHRSAGAAPEAGGGWESSSCASVGVAAGQQVQLAWRATYMSGEA